jgi:hypothetical protein
MKTRNTLKPLVLSLAIAGAVAAIPAAQAQTAATTSSPTTATTSTTTTAPSKSSLVKVMGIVTGSPETVAFKGTAVVTSDLARDPDFNLPQLIFTLDMSGVTGIGTTSRKQYVVSGPEIIQRRLAPTHTVEILFPFVVANGNPLSAQSGVGSFSIDVDQDTGYVVRATGDISTPSY